MASSHSGKRLLTIGIAVAAFLTAADVYRLARPFYSRNWVRYSFYDFRIFRAAVRDYSRTGCLYKVASPRFFQPGSRVYKYPPTYAALLKPFVGVKQAFVGRLFFYATLVLLLVSFALLVWLLRPPGWLILTSGLVFAVWKPTWESISNLQLEPLLLFLLVASYALLGKRRGFLAGVGIGVAGALKIYPWALLAVFAARRRWSVLLGAGAGAAAALSLASLAFPPRLFLEYFGEILPRLGGTSLSRVNVGLLAHFGRAALWATAGLPSAEKIEMLFLEGPGLTAARVLGTGGLLLVVLAAVVLLRGRLLPHLTGRSSSGADRELAVGVCLLLLLIPTSWLNYQTLLVLPLMVAAAEAARPALDRSDGVMLGICAAVGCLAYSFDASYERWPVAMSIARTLLPFLVLGVLIRGTETGARGVKAALPRSPA